MNSQKLYVIGVDGGGSKTNAVLVDLDGSVLAESTGAPTQLHTVGMKEAAAVLFGLIKECCLKVNCGHTSLQSVVMGISGAGSAVVRNELTDIVLSLGLRKKFLLKNIVVETDARIALEAAFAGAPGIVVIAGTGSIALYRTEEGKILRAGGWGKILGDEGGSYAIARDALNAVMRQFDGRGGKTELTQKAFTHFGIKMHDELILKIYRDKIDITSFTPLVLEAGSERDRTANGIFQKNAGELSELVRTLIMQVRPRKKLPLALMGGLLEQENYYSKIVREKIFGSLPNIVIQKPKFPAALGAAIIGLNAFR